MSFPSIFAENTYDTPGDRRDRLTKLLCNFRYNFYFRIYYNFYRIGKCSRQGRFDRVNQARYSAGNADILERCGARIHLRGLEHLSAEPGPFVIAGNHMSAVETMILNAVISPRLDFTFVIKQGLFGVPFMRQAMRAVGAIGVGQLNPREDFKVIMEEGERCLRGGKSVLIFPEAARCETFLPERFNTIAVKLARKAGVKVIPFALKTDFLKFGRLIRECGPVCPENEIHLEFGAPISISGTGREEQLRIIEFIRERCMRWSNGAEKEPL